MFEIIFSNIHITILIILLILFIMLSIASLVFTRLKKERKLMSLVTILLAIILTQTIKVEACKKSRQLDIEILKQEGIIIEWDYENVIADTTNNYLDRLYPELIKAR